MKVFTIPNFKKGGASFGFAKNHLSKRLQNFRGQIYGEEIVLGNKKVPAHKLNLIQRIMKNVTTPVLIE